MRATRLYLVALSMVSALALSGCGLEEEIVAVDEQPVERPQPTANQLDVLFVIDSSNSMCEEQAELMAAADDLAAALTADGRDARLAVVTTDMVSLADGVGNFRTAPGSYRDIGACSLAPLPDTSACPNSLDAVLRTSQLTPEALADAMRCLFAAGIDGNFVEMGLDAAATALEQPAQAQELVRPGSRLVVVFVTDENDCSDGTFGGQQGPVYQSIVGGQGDGICEFRRNLEDSCTYALEDTMTLQPDGITYTIEEHPGPNLEIGGVERAARTWCERGVRAEIDVLADQLDLACPKGGCHDDLIPRATLRQRLLQVVADRNGFTDPADAEAFVEVIAVINPDQGVRVDADGSLPPVCGMAGQAGYRYQQFARSFARSAVMPICDPNTGQPTSFGPTLVQAIVDATP